MAVNVVLNGVTYSIPDPGDSAWGQGLTDYFVAQASGLLQKAGGTFTLTAEVDFGATYGLKSLYYKSRGSNPSTTGQLRLSNAESISWRNAANDANLALSVDSSNNLTFNGVVISSSSGVVPPTSGGTGLTSYTTGDTLYASATNVLSKLAIGNADDVFKVSGGLPAWGKLTNSNVDAAAAIARSKLGTGTADHVVINAGDGTFSSEAQLAKVRGGTGQDNSSLTFPSTGTVPAYTPTNHGVVISGSGAAATVTGAGSAGQVLTSNGASADPTFQDAPSAPSASYELLNLSLSASISSNILTVELKTQSGSNPSAGDPVRIGFRDTTATNGTYSRVLVTGATSLTIGTTASLGLASGASNTLYIYALNNAGTVELFASAHAFWDEGTVQSTSTTATSNRVLYGANARSNMAVRLIGAVAATWTSGVGYSSLASIKIKPFNVPPLAARYTTSSTTFAAANTINFATKDYDQYNAVATGASWTFTCLVAGKYRISTNALCGATAFSAGNAVSLSAYKSGSPVAQIAKHIVYVTQTFTPGLGNAITIDANAGDTLYIAGASNVSVTLDGSANNYVCIELVNDVTS